jgi:uncharacterized protein with von Willebrand factor type A (vWA) domain
VVDQVDAMRDGATERLAKNPALKKTIDPFVAKLDKMKETLVVMKGDNYVGAAEPQLREKLANLYSEVAGYYGRPSGAQLANVKIMDTKLKEAQTALEAMKAKQLADMNVKFAKAKSEEIKLRSFDEFKTAEK